MMLMFRTLQHKRGLYIGLCILLLTGFVAAHDAPPPTPAPSPGQDVQIVASDGKKLYGSYFSKSDAEGRAVILLHQLYANRSSWTPLIYPLLDAGFKVLAIDLRGYGKTKGKINWKVAQEDTVNWADWVKGQPGVTSVATVGSSMGANLAINGCAAIAGCVGAVAISPSLNYFNVTTNDALQAGFPVLIVYADRDTFPKQDVPHMLELGSGHTDTIVYSGRTHGIDLFGEYDDLIPAIVAWVQAR
jgi:alpha-beta hydrolase superfamily lysophospholipase